MLASYECGALLRRRFTVLLGVADYVPALKAYVERYGAQVRFGSQLVAIVGPALIAIFEQASGAETQRVKQAFDLIHVVQPQRAPDLVAHSPLAASSG